MPSAPVTSARAADVVRGEAGCATMVAQCGTVSRCGPLARTSLSAVCPSARPPVCPHACVRACASE